MIENIDREDGIIRKIVVGIDYKTAMAYEVGKKKRNPQIGEYSVYSIQVSEFDSVYHKVKSYNVYIEYQGDIKLWKTFENVAIAVEYELCSNH